MMKNPRQRVSEHETLMKQFDCDKNVGISPFDLFVSNSKSVWWKCEKGHSWSVSPGTRIIRKGNLRVRPCPYCSGRKASPENNLTITHDSLCREWNYKRNGFGPESVTHKSATKVWWLCRYGHEWQAQIYSRAHNGAGCPKCSCKQTSHIELRIYSELKSIFPDTERDFRVDGMRVDIVLPFYKIAIEIDGSYWHKRKADSDAKKDARLARHGYAVIRVRERSLPSTGCETVWYEDGNSHLDICEKVVQYISDRVGKSIEYDGWRNEILFFNLISEVGGYGRKISEKYPLLSNEWHHKKNSKLKFEDLTIGTSIKVWWVCPSGHEYQMSVKERGRGRGCPYCAGKKVSPENSLSSERISGEWLFSMNAGKSPCDFMKMSNKTVWWKCKRGHVWNASICSRVKGSGCPYCARKRKSRETIEYERNQKDIESISDA